MSSTQPGEREQQQLREDPSRLKDAQQGDDAVVDESIRERQSERLRQEFQYWWRGLSPEEALDRAGRRDELLALLNEKYGYAREEAEAQIEASLRELEDRRRAR